MLIAHPDSDVALKTATAQRGDASRRRVQGFSGFQGFRTRGNARKCLL
jgi:hypothetical protein